MKKVILTKTAISFATKRLDERPTEDNKISSTYIANNSTYSQRKKMQPQYKELFSALFRIPDRKIQERVIAAINGSESPQPIQVRLCCNKCRSVLPVADRKFADSSTQTEQIAVSRLSHDMDAIATKMQQKTDNADTSSVISRSSSTEITTADNNKTPTETSPAEEPTEPPKRKRRKRKICLPQVAKKSQAQQMQSQVQPKLKRLKPEQSSTKPNILSRSNSLYQQIPDVSLSDLEGLVQECLQPNMESTSKQIAQTMALEFCQSEHMENGMLPIHEAIATSELNKFRRQLIVWQHKEVNLNELITDEDQDCLQLAVMCNSLPQIVEILLDAGLDVNCMDSKGHSIVHLAILNDVDMKTLNLLMDKIDLALLLKLNDDGHTPLHMAVRHDRYLHAEVLINVLDQRTLGSRVYNRSPEKEEDNSKQFLEFYENACDRLDRRTNAAFAKTKQQVAENARLKRGLLETGEMCSGNTALFGATENGLEHMIYFLLAHMADPRSQNHCGQDVKSYFTEFGKLMNLSLKIDRTMDKVIELL